MSLFFEGTLDILSLTILPLQKEHPDGTFPCWSGQGMGAVLGNALQGLSTRWEQQHRRPPALDVPQDARWGGTATLFSSQDFVCRQEGLFDLTAMGKAAAFRRVWKKAPALAVAPIRRAVALKVKGSVRGDPWAFGRGGTPRRMTAWSRSS